MERNSTPPSEPDAVLAAIAANGDDILLELQVRFNRLAEELNANNRHWKEHFQTVHANQFQLFQKLESRGTAPGRITCVQLDTSDSGESEVGRARVRSASALDHEERRRLLELAHTMSRDMADLAENAARVGRLLSAVSSDLAAGRLRQLHPDLVAACLQDVKANLSTLDSYIDAALAPGKLAQYCGA